MQNSMLADLPARCGPDGVMPVDGAESTRPVGPRVPVGGWQPCSWKRLFLTAGIVVGCHRCAGARRHSLLF